MSEESLQEYSSMPGNEILDFFFVYFLTMLFNIIWIVCCQLYHGYKNYKAFLMFSLKN